MNTVQRLQRFIDDYEANHGANADHVVLSFGYEEKVLLSDLKAAVAAMTKED